MPSLSDSIFPTSEAWVELVQNKISTYRKVRQPYYKLTNIVLCSLRRRISPSLNFCSATCSATSNSFLLASTSAVLFAWRSLLVWLIANCAFNCASSSCNSQLYSTWALFWDSSTALLAFSLSKFSTLLPVHSLYLQPGKDVNLCRGFCGGLIRSCARCTSQEYC